MKNQFLEVIDVPWSDRPNSWECTVRFKNDKESSFSCFLDEGYIPVKGEILEIESFSLWELGGDEDPEWYYIDNNPTKVKDIKETGEWKCLLFGQIIEHELEGHIAIVDCGGIHFELEGYAGDRACIGDWIGAKIDRLDVNLPLVSQ